MEVITLPPRLNLTNSLAFGNYLTQLDGNTDYLFDFSKMRYIGPFGLVYVSSCIEDVCARCPDNEPSATGYHLQGYPAHMGFFKVFDLDHGNSPGQAKGSTRYIPITMLDAVEIRRHSATTGEAIGSIIEERSQQIASVLTQEIEGDLHDTVAYSIREVLRNAVEHSQSHTVRFCAQYYPKSNTVEVVILDKGRGILESLAPNPFIAPTSHREAINFALMPGVSGTAFKGSKINSRKDDWKNSGYGLYMTNRICRMGGDFFIGSGSIGIYLANHTKRDIPLNHNGTVLRLTIRLDNVANLKSRLLEFSHEGQQIAAKLRGTIITPSSASHMLTVDYKNS